VKVAEKKTHDRKKRRNAYVGTHTHTHTHRHTHTHIYKVVQIWPEHMRLVYTEISPGHIWTTLYIPWIQKFSTMTIASAIFHETQSAQNMQIYIYTCIYVTHTNT
jgi:hypothetical protein